MEAWSDVVSGWLAPLVGLAMLLFAPALIGLFLIGLSRFLRRRRHRLASPPADSVTPSSPPSPQARPGKTDSGPVTQVVQVFRPDGPATPEEARLTNWLFRLGVAGIVVSLLAWSSLALINAVYFEQTMTWLFDRLEPSTGFRVEFEQAQGSLWRGQVELRQVEIERVDPVRGNVQLQFQTLDLHLNVISLLTVPRFHSISAEGVRGRVELVVGKKPDRSGKPFVIERFDLDDADFELTGKRGSLEVPAPITVQHWSTAPLRSEWLAFDLYFHTNASGSVRDLPVRGTSKTMGDSRKSHWEAPDLPLDLAAFALGPPFSWLQEGEVSLATNELTQPLDANEIRLDCSVTFHHLKVRPTEEIPLAIQLAVAPVIDWIDAHGDELALEFPVKLRRRQFEGRANWGEAGFDVAIGDAIVEELGKRSGVDVSELMRSGRELVNKLRDLLDR